MHKNSCIPYMYRKVLALMIAASLYSCVNNHESIYFNCEQKQFSDVKTFDIRDKLSDIDIAFVPPCVVFCDSIAISRHWRTSEQELFSVTRISDGELLGVFCPKGRSGDEPLIACPFFDVTIESKQIKVWFQCQIPQRLYVWNVTESLAQGKTVYENQINICPWNCENPTYSAPFSAHVLGNKRVVYYNPNHDAAIYWMDTAPSFDIYNLATGQKEKTFCPFNVCEEFGDDESDFSSKRAYDLVETLNPKRNKLAFAMHYLPYAGILDLNTGNCTVFRINEGMGLQKDREYMHFESICCDDKYIYATYMGVYADKIAETNNTKLIIFDWNGAMKGKYLVGAKAVLYKNGSDLLLLDPTGDGLHRLPIEALEL